MQASTITLLLLINILFGLIALSVGFVAGGWFLSPKRPENEAKSPTTTPVSPQETLELERALLASSRLRDLATSMATDVGEHNFRVEQITSELRSIQPTDAAEAEAGFLGALAKIAAANEQLQNRLEKAEQQIQSQAEEIRSRESEARTDSLTQVANRRAFDVEVGHRFAEWQRMKTPFSLILLDIDHFKRFNDTHGHQAGDEVLKRAATMLQSVVREMDLPCRYGGEEFAIVLPNTVAAEACKLCERIRQAIEALVVEWEGESLRITTSVGVAEITTVGTTNLLLKRADEALYQSKQAGRNCTHLFDGQRCVPITPGIKAPSEVSPALDTLTQHVAYLPNRTIFSEELRRRVAESHRSAQPLSVLAVEVEEYSRFKREYGDATARLTLESVAEFLKNTLREMDLLGRLEDGRFGILLPGSSEEEAKTVGDRARKALAGCTLPMGDDEMRLTVRLGCSEVHPDDTAASIMERAERQLDHRPIRATAETVA